MAFKYIDFNGKSYFLNSDGLRTTEGKIPVAYVSPRNAKEAYDLKAKGKNSGEIMTRLKQLEYAKPGGVVVYLYKCNLCFSKKIVSRIPNFSSLEDSVMCWLEKVDAEEKDQENENIVELKEEPEDKPKPPPQQIAR